MGNEYAPPASPIEILFSGQGVHYPSPFVHITAAPLVQARPNVAYSVGAGLESSSTAWVDTALMPVLVVVLQNIATTGDVKADLILESNPDPPFAIEEKRWSLAAGHSFFTYVCKARYNRLRIKNWGTASLTLGLAIEFRSEVYGV